MNDVEAKAIADGAWRNRGRMAPGTACGCFRCQATFVAGDVRQWVDQGMTALCPRCGVDAVLPGVTDATTLRDLHDCRFGQTCRPSAAAWEALAAGSRSA